jgi:lipopolysaccharide transport system ATP-binding protein
MSQPIIVVENLSKLYELGTIGTRTLQESLQRRWYRMRGREHLLQHAGASRKMVAPGHPQAGPRPNTMWALKDVSLSVNEGEVLGIIGRNGAGKSTLLKILTRITEPTSGRALVYGRVASLLEVGTGFHPELTGRENIYLNGAILGMKRDEVSRKFDEIVAFSEVEQFIDTPVKRYSSGMYVRLAFAVAAHLEPEILLVDEVLAVGDTEFQKKCLGKMHDVAEGGRTVLFVSHNMAAVLSLCSRAVLLHDGRVTQSGAANDVVDQYLSFGQQVGVFTPTSGTRTGDQRATITDLRMRPDHPKTGLPLEFTFFVNRSDGGGELAAELGIAIKTERDVELLQLHSRHMGHEFVFPPGGSQVVVRLDRLPLAPGRYRVNAWLGKGDVPIDWPRDCLVFDVDTGSFNGRDFVQNRGYPVLVPSTWQKL